MDSSPLVTKRDEIDLQVFVDIFFEQSDCIISIIEDTLGSLSFRIDLSDR